ncbi:hypothetical protein SAMN04490182_2854 [Pseudomonas cedrina]|uniref:Conjugal transfer protein n=1 Tax=Pseudomonas cedrina TaxID=651740 RepID=A0ABY0UNI1_PSECE|nr:hypothetical protein [Pseudomonas cedrina]SDS95238.1 hypothetical protein SAMN04490182_2854 [Pseudomonas cedrina]
MAINVIPGLPLYLQAMIEQVNAEEIGYGDREQHVQQLNEYLTKGDHSSVKFKAGQMIERQQQARSQMQHGLPLHLQAMIDQVNAEEIGYGDREQHVQQLNEYLTKGDHSSVKFKAGQMIERQQQARSQMQHGLPLHLQAMIDQVNAEEIGYGDREQHVQQLNEYLTKGDHSSVKFKAGQMIERQQQARSQMQHGLPLDLQAMIDQVNAEEIGYGDREQHVQQLNEYLTKGDHSSVKFKAGQMIERQQQYRFQMQHGLPLDLQAMIDQVNAEEIGYCDREQHVQQLNEYLTKGDHSSVKFKAGQMIERQRNIHSQNANREGSN